MNESQPSSPEARPRRNYNRRAVAAPAGNGPIRSIAINPIASGMVLLEIKMELPLLLAIELAGDAAKIQSKADEAGLPASVAPVMISPP
jgi:hypothetical protein